MYSHLIRVKDAHDLIARYLQVWRIDLAEDVVQVTRFAVHLALCPRPPRHIDVPVKHPIIPAIIDTIAASIYHTRTNTLLIEGRRVCRYKEHRRRSEKNTQSLWSGPKPPSPCLCRHHTGRWSDCSHMGSAPMPQLLWSSVCTPASPVCILNPLLTYGYTCMQLRASVLYVNLFFLTYYNASFGI